MAAESKKPDNKATDLDNLWLENLEIANNWISEYKKPGSSRKALYICDDMTLDQVALITKLLLKERESEESTDNELPDTFYFVWQKSYTVFYEKICWKVNDPQNHITHVESFLDDEYSFDAMKQIIDTWEPERKGSFHEFVISFRLPQYFKYRNTYRKHYDKILEYYSIKLELEKNKSKYEVYSPILYTILLYIDVLPHKIIIFIYLALFYSSEKNCRLKEFFNEKFSCSLKELYDDIDEQYIEKKFNEVFENKYGNDLLKKQAGDLYNGADYREMISLAGENTITEDLITSIFFWYNFQNYPFNPDYEKIRNVISQWNSHLKREAIAILQDQKRKMNC